jgi:2'-5' RNA ligase
MITKYIIALLALNPLGFTEFAQKHFSAVSQGYIIGKDSHPHITLAQFMGSESDLEASIIYLKTYTSCASPKPAIKGISFLKDPKASDIWWAECFIARTEALMSLQRNIESFLRERNITLINDTGDLYRPHLTLARIKEPLPTINLSVLPFLSDFHLVIAEADQLGQLIKIIEVFKP